MTTAENHIRARLTARQQAGSYRSLKPENSLVDFCSNDYLGFARSSVLKNNIAAELNKHSSLNGATGSRLISGNLVYTEFLEREIAALFNSEAALLFNSGYDANLGLLSSLPQRGDTIINDELIHASIIDGGRLSNANRYTFKHNDLVSLEAKLQRAKGIVYVVIESVYSMDGDTPPLAEILTLTEKYGANLIVDEAHAVGLYKTGIVTNLGLQDRIFARTVTFGKALGCHGAVILGSNLLRQYLINFARSFIYTTAAPFHQLAGIKAASDMLINEAIETEQLRKNIALFKQAIKLTADSPCNLIESDSSIQCIVLKSSQKATDTAAELQRAGFDVRAIVSPTVPQGSERIRICLHSFNTTGEINLLAHKINTLANAS
ncbi:8-amino-7-oxononanoate synthase [Mucilaginibacter sp. UR6-11]|uniref:aminotransferase class I/II-fold pyridoxal phosphate-dependent enzyme n=1 Tax=Mucilaginibacter sp. UR6-11 TaxID=1435644 RepID=UPI001E3490EA|nr:8-amino-7-oxononanoate synthase [Mucilaginibacter sp. UR6-11]MCC8425843.1 8-amino-7-oxononanoate synthase [Mucilaginibacter sp. UR6-11]